MTIQEWLAGFSAILNLSVLSALIVYLVNHRPEIRSAPYCMAVGLVGLITGQCIRHIDLWTQLMTNHEITAENIRRYYPFVGSPLWLWAGIIVSLGLLKILHELGKAYIGHWGWIAGMTLACIIPFLTMVL